MSDQTNNVPDWLNRETVIHSPRRSFMSRVYSFVVVALATFLVCILVWNVVLAQVWLGRQQERQQLSSTRRELDEWATKIIKSGRQLDVSWAALQKALDTNQEVHTRMQARMKSVNTLHKELIESLDQISTELVHQSGELAATQEKSKSIVAASEAKKTSELVAAEVAKNQSLAKLQSELSELRVAKSNMQPQHPMFMQVINLIKQKELEIENIEQGTENGQVRIVQNQFYNPTTLPAKKVESEVKPMQSLDLSELQDWSKETQSKCDKLRKELSSLTKGEASSISRSASTAKASSQAIQEFEAKLKHLESIAKSPLKTKLKPKNELKPLLGSITLAMMLLGSCGFAAVVNFSRKRQATKPKTIHATEPLTIEEITRTLGSTPLGILPMEQIEVPAIVSVEPEIVAISSPIFNVKKICTVCEAIAGSVFLLTVVMMFTNQQFNLIIRQSPLIAWGRWIAGQ